MCWGGKMWVIISNWAEKNWLSYMEQKCAARKGDDDDGDEDDEVKCLEKKDSLIKQTECVIECQMIRSTFSNGRLSKS